MKEFGFTEVCESHDYTEPESWADDSIDQYQDADEEGLNPKLIDATAKELSDMRVSSMCGIDGNNSFSLVAKKYPNLKIRTCIADTYEGDSVEHGSCMIYLDSKEQGEEVSDLVDKADGSLRFDTCFEYHEGHNHFPMWAYFENE